MREVSIRVDAGDAELAADRLWAAGARAVEERPAADGRVDLRSVLSSDDDLSRARLAPYPADWEIAFTDVDDTPSAAWRDYATPIAVSERLTISPAWLPVPDAAGLVVAIEPGAAFGLGDHPTTRLSAAMLDDLTLDGRSVLDVGCGTGVLATIAALRGASPVVGIDVADAAVDATRDNAARNEVALETSTTPLADVDDVFDVVVANILAPTLIELADDLHRVTRRTLIISGVLANAHDHVLDALLPLHPAEARTLDGWTAVRFDVD